MTPVEWLLLALAALALGLLYFGWTVRITVVNPTHLDMRVGDSATVEAVLFRKPAFRTTPERTQGTVKLSARSSLVAVTPSEAGSSHQTAASFRVDAVTVGEGKAFILAGRSRHGDHDAVEVTVKVTVPPPPPPE
jgi:hypothetical protein